MTGANPNQDASGTASALLEEVRALVQELHPGMGLDEAMHLDSAIDKELGIDSLGRAELLARLEARFGVSLSERVFADAGTPRDLVRAVLGASAAGQGGPTLDRIDISQDESTGAPVRSETLVDALRWHAERHPERCHIRIFSDTDDGETISYGELWERASRVAESLRQRGVQRGTPVALMLPTGPDYFACFSGVLLAGGVPAPMYPPASRRRIEEHLRRHRAILANCAAPLLITTDEARQFAQLLRSQLTTLAHVVTPAALADAGTALPSLPSLTGGDMAFLQYTSGSTGDPKGVILTHANLLANIRAMGTAVGVTSEDVFVSWLPLYHDMGLIGAWLGSLYHGMQFVVMSPLSFLTRPKRWFAAIHRYGGTLSAAPNFAYELCVRRLTDADMAGIRLDSWRAACNGAEPVTPETIEAFWRRFAGFGLKRESLMPVYGLAECSVGLTFPPMGRGPRVDAVDRDTFSKGQRAVPVPPDTANALRFVACGQPLPGHAVRAVGPDGRELPERCEGHLQFRGPSTCQGYFHNPTSTQDLFDGEWLNSGDLAYVAEGDVYVTGRAKDVIIRAGRNIYPQEIEERVGELAGIRSGGVAAFGSADTESGTERLIVVAETRRRDEQELQALQQAVVEAVTAVAGEAPDDVALAAPGAVLKTSSGKVRRAATKQQYERGELGACAAGGALRWIRLGLLGLAPSMRRGLRRGAAFMYGAYAWTLLGLAFPFMWLAVMLLPRLGWRWSWLHSCARVLAGLLRVPVMRRGVEHLPEAGPCVLVSNHTSYLDCYALLTVLRRPVRFIGKTELLHNPFLALFLKRLGTRFVERFDRMQSLQDAREMEADVQGELPVFFFPEGTFTRAPGVLPFHMGAFMLAARVGAPVVPVAIRGTRSMLRAETWLPRRGAVSITVGAALTPQPIAEVDAGRGENDRELWREAVRLRGLAREHILRFCGEPDLGREAPPI